MKTNVQNTKPENDLIKYYPDGNVKILLDNILTLDHIVHPNMKVLKMEGSHFDTINILEIWDDGDYVYLKVKDIKTQREHELVQILDRENKYFLWSIIDLDYAMGMMEDKIVEKINN